MQNKTKQISSDLRKWVLLKLTDSHYTIRDYPISLNLYWEDGI